MTKTWNEHIQDMIKAPEGSKLPDPPIRRTLTFNFTVQEWQALASAASKGSLALPPDEAHEVDQIIKVIADQCGQFDSLGRYRRVE